MEKVNSDEKIKEEGQSHRSPVRNDESERSPAPPERNDDVIAAVGRIEVDERSKQGEKKHPVTEELREESEKISKKRPTDLLLAGMKKKEIRMREVQAKHSWSQWVPRRK